VGREIRGKGRIPWKLSRMKRRGAAEQKWQGGGGWKGCSGSEPRNAMGRRSKGEISLDDFRTDLLECAEQKYRNELQRIGKQYPIFNSSLPSSRPEEGEEKKVRNHISNA